MFEVKIKKGRVAKLKNVIFSLVGIGFGLVLVFLSFYFIQAATIVNVTGAAQVSNTGAALHFTGYNANVTANNDTHQFAGYAWSEDVGWVAFGTADNPDGPVVFDQNSGAVSGQARVISTGANIDFNAAPYNSNVIINADGSFTGYAWSTDVGWLNFQGVSAPGIIIGPTPSPSPSPSFSPTITRIVPTEPAPETVDKKEIIEFSDFKFYLILENGNLEIKIDDEKDFELVKNSELLVEIPADIFAKEVNVITITTADSSYLMNLLADKNKYQAVIPMPQIKGEYELRILIVYKDGTIQEIKKTIVVDPEGYVFTKSSSYFGLGRKQEMRIEGAEVTLFKFENGKFQKWDAGGFKQNNPVISGQSGEYSFFVPNGEYYLEVKKAGFKDKKTDNFKVENQVLNKNIELEPNVKSWVWLIFIILALIILITAMIIYLRRRKYQGATK